MAERRRERKKGIEESEETARVETRDREDQGIVTETKEESKAAAEERVKVTRREIIEIRRKETRDGGQGGVRKGKIQKVSETYEERMDKIGDGKVDMRDVEYAMTVIGRDRVDL